MGRVRSPCSSVVPGETGLHWHQTNGPKPALLAQNHTWAFSHHICGPALRTGWPGLMFRSRSAPAGPAWGRLGSMRAPLQARGAGNPFPGHSWCWQSATQDAPSPVVEAFLLSVAWMPSSAPCRLAVRRAGTEVTEPADSTHLPPSAQGSPRLPLAGGASGSPLLYALGSRKGIRPCVLHAKHTAHLCDCVSVCLCGHPAWHLFEGHRPGCRSERGRGLFFPGEKSCSETHLHLPS